MIFAIDTRCTARLTICIGTMGIEARAQHHRPSLQPVRSRFMGQDNRNAAQDALPSAACVPFGLAVIMQRVKPLSQDECHQLIDEDGFPDWDYVPPDETCPFEYKASDWGRLPDGRLVALDYSTPALNSPDESEVD